MTYIAYEGEGRDGYRDQIVTCDVGVSLHSKIHSLFMKYSTLFLLVFMFITRQLETELTHP